MSSDNRLAEKAGRDRNLVALELQELSVEPNFDVTETGFDTAEIDILITEAIDAEPDEADIVPASSSLEGQVRMNESFKVLFQRENTEPQPVASRRSPS